MEFFHWLICIHPLMMSSKVEPIYYSKPYFFLPHCKCFKQVFSNKIRSPRSGPCTFNSKVSTLTDFTENESQNPIKARLFTSPQWKNQEAINSGMSAPLLPEKKKMLCMWMSLNCKMHYLFTPYVMFYLFLHCTSIYFSWGVSLQCTPIGSFLHTF